MEGACPTVVVGGTAAATGKVGSTARIVIDAGSRQIGGSYTVIWSRTAISENGTSTDYIELAKGSFPRETTTVEVDFTVPEAPYGISYVQYQRPAKDPFGLTFTVIPDIKVSPTSVSTGTKVTVKGTGFPANKDVILSFDGTDTGLDITANTLGSFSTSYTISDTIAGKHEFKASVWNMSLGNDITTSLQVKPKVTLEPNEPEVGADVTMTGSGFASSSQVTIKYDDIVIPNSPAADKPLATDANGNFSHTFTVPETPKDEHVITATDKAGNSATFGMLLEGESPPAPSPISPGEKNQRFGTFGAQTVIFTWGEVSDPSGVTYTIEVDDNLNFFPLEPGMRKTGLTSPNCTMRLEPGTYYWRVKAIDGANNESGWALSPYPFEVGLLSTWIIVGGILVLAIAFIFIVRAFFRRVREYYK